jgi:ornithine cyclodeaminase
MITVLNERELRECAVLDRRAVDTIAGAFAALHRGEAVMPPVASMDMAERNAECDVKMAWMRGLDGFAVKVSTGFFDNPSRGLPSLSGMMTLFSTETGRVQAVLLDNGWLTDLRTAAAGAVAARYLARSDARTAAVLGTGLQARLQLEALTLVRGIERAVVWGRDADKAAALARDCTERLGIAMDTAATPAEAIRQADVAVTTTPAREPLVTAEMLHRGLHITAMGSDAEGKSEIAPEAIAAADVYVCDRQAQCAERGELRAAVLAGVVSAHERFPEIGAIAAAEHGGREHDDQVTIADLTGTGVQDTAIAVLALDEATSRRYGTRLDDG